MPLLDPRYYRVDDLLRRPFRVGEPMGSAGGDVWAVAAPGWGFESGVYWRNRTENDLAPIRLLLRADGEVIVPAEGVFRPSHVTLNARGTESGVQVTEDRFITGDDVLVSALSLRNPGETPIAVRIDHTFGVGAGQAEWAGDEPVYIWREGPPGDDLRFRLNPFAVRTLVFAVGFGSTADEATRRVWRWRNNLDPVRSQREDWQARFDEDVPGFDCPDPWFMRLWYHRWYVAFRNGGDADLPGTALADDEVSRTDNDRHDAFRAWERYCHAQFVDGDFDRPYTPAIPWFVRSTGFGRGREHCQWATRILRELLGISWGSDGFFAMRPLLSSGVWPYFCVENVPYQGHVLTVVWDDPTEREDAYHDGDKGLTIYMDGIRLHHQAELLPVSVPWILPTAIDNDF